MQVTGVLTALAETFLLRAERFRLPGQGIVRGLAPAVRRLRPQFLYFEPELERAGKVIPDQIGQADGHLARPVLAG